MIFFSCYDFITCMTINCFLLYFYFGVCVSTGLLWQWHFRPEDSTEIKGINNRLYHCLALIHIYSYLNIFIYSHIQCWYNTLNLIKPTLMPFIQDGGYFEETQIMEVSLLLNLAIYSIPLMSIDCSYRFQTCLITVVHTDCYGCPIHALSQSPSPRSQTSKCLHDQVGWGQTRYVHSCTIWCVCFHWSV